MKKIPLTQGKVAIVDDEDYESLVLYKWRSTKKKVAKTSYANRIDDDGRCILMHRMILGIEYRSPVVVDHKNGDGLDNRRKNLRIATIAENGRNRGKQKNNKSGYKGVSRSIIPNSLRIRWRAQIQHKGKEIHIGMFDTPEEAHEAYKKYAKKLHGEFANTG